MYQLYLNKAVTKEKVMEKMTKINVHGYPQKIYSFQLGVGRTQRPEAISKHDPEAFHFDFSHLKASMALFRIDT